MSRINRAVVISIFVVAIGCVSPAVMAQGQVKTGLVAYYQFEGNLADVSGSGHDGTASGGGEAAFVSGFFGLAVDTREAAVDCGTWDPSDPDTDAFSASCWVYWLGLQGAAAQWQGVLAKRSGWGAGLSRWQLELGDNSATAYLTNQPNGGPGSVTLTQDEWQHIAITFDGSDAAIYSDGEQVGAGAWTLDNAIDAPLCIGMSQPTNGNNFNGYIDEVAFWNRGLSEDEIAFLYNSGEGQPVMGPPTTATEPSPADGALDVAQDTALSWTPSAFAASHNVYFGTSWDDVNSANVNVPMGVLVSRGQGTSSFEPDDVLDFDQTYYWRIDDVNGAPDFAVHKGSVWSFTVEPFAYPVENIIATASSAEADSGPENTVNGSGLDAADQHSIASTAMWLTSATAPQPAWIQYELPEAYMLSGMWVWNYNVQFEPVLGFGLKDTTIEYSIDGIEWTTLGDFEFARGTAKSDYAHNTTIDLDSVFARYVRLTANSNWGGMMPQFGLSEVRFFHKPVVAREPIPADGQTDVGLDIALDWRSGREAAEHQVHFGMDEQAVIDGAALLDTVKESHYDVTALNLGTTYYWQIVEVNEAEAISAWVGPVWSFSTREYVLIEGFETYNDDIDAGTTIFDTWVDGWVNGNGSTVGYFDVPFAEKTIVHSGAQSMPIQYDNTTSPFYSEAERIFDSPQNWSVNGADTLVMYFRGVPGSFAELPSGKIIMGAAGADIWNAADEFRFAYKPLNGNGSVVAYVESVANTDPWAKAGVMIRETLDAGSTFAAVYTTPGNGCRYQGRLTTDAAAVSDSPVATAEQIALDAPHWVKIERVGDAFNGYYSTDGENWTSMSWNPQTIVMGVNVYIGLAVNSHSTGVLTSAQFSDVATTGNVTGQWAVETIGPEQPEGNAMAPLYVTLEDATGKTATVTHPAGDAATLLGGWNEWAIPYSDLAGLNLSRVAVITIGVGDPTSPNAGGSGILYIDDIQYGKPATAE